MRRLLISGTPCCMFHFGIEWESAWYPNVQGWKFDEEVGAACGVVAQKVPPPDPYLPPPGGRGRFYSLDSGSRPLRGLRPERGRNDVEISATNFRNGTLEDGLDIPDLPGIFGDRAVA